MDNLEGLSNELVRFKPQILFEPPIYPVRIMLKESCSLRNGSVQYQEQMVFYGRVQRVGPNYIAHADGYTGPKGRALIAHQFGNGREKGTRRRHGLSGDVMYFQEQCNSIIVSMLSFFDVCPCLASLCKLWLHPECAREVHGVHSVLGCLESSISLIGFRTSSSYAREISTK